MDANVSNIVFLKIDNEYKVYKYLVISSTFINLYNISTSEEDRFVS